MTLLTIIMLRNDYSNDNYGIKWLFLTIIMKQHSIRNDYS